jgi:hypothetical protein
MIDDAAMEEAAARALSGKALSSLGETLPPSSPRKGNPGRDVAEAPMPQPLQPATKKTGGFFGSGRKKAENAAPDALPQAPPSPPKKGTAAVPTPKDTEAEAKRAAAAATNQVVAASALRPAGPKRELDEVYPLVAEFHPSFTLMGTQPAFVVAMRGGLLAKCNRPGAERSVYSAPVCRPLPLGTEEEAAEVLALRRVGEKPDAAEAAAARAGRGKERAKSGGPRPSSRERGGPGETLAPLFPASLISREYFTGHPAPLVFVGFVHNNSLMITVDELGLLLEWPYRKENYSDYGWFRPAKSMQLGLTVRLNAAEPSTEQVHFPPAGLQRGAIGDSVALAPKGKKGKEPEPAPRSAGNNTGYSDAFASASREHDWLVNAHLKLLPERPWRTQRLDDGTVRSFYGDPIEENHTCEMTIVDRDNRGTLLRHASCRYAHKRVKGSLITACLNPTSSVLVTLTLFDNLPEGPHMRIQQLSVTKGQREFLKLKVTIPLGDQGGWDAQTRLLLKQQGKQAERPVKMVVSSYLDLPGTDYVFLLLDNAVRIYSLGSGVQVRPPIRPLGRDMSVSLDSLAVTSDGKRIAVGCSSVVPQHKASGVFVYYLQPPTDHRRSELLAVRTGSARIGTIPIEQRIFSPHFYLGRDQAGALSEHKNIVDFMRTTAWGIVDEALESAEPTPLEPFMWSIEKAVVAEESAKLVRVELALLGCFGTLVDEVVCQLGAEVAVERLDSWVSEDDEFAESEDEESMESKVR